MYLFGCSIVIPHSRPRSAKSVAMRSKTTTMARLLWHATCALTRFANLAMNMSVATVTNVALNAILFTNATKVNYTKPCFGLYKSIPLAWLSYWWNDLFEGSPKIAGDEEENNGLDDSDDELNIKNRQDASSIHQNFAYGSVLYNFDQCFFHFFLIWNQDSEYFLGYCRKMETTIVSSNGVKMAGPFLPPEVVYISNIYVCFR